MSQTMNDQQTPTDSVDPVDPITEARASHAMLRYSTLRLAIFVVALGLLWLVRVRGVLLVALALLISGLASYALLRPQREAMSVQLATASKRRRERSVARAAREDAAADELAHDELAHDELAHDELAHGELAEGERAGDNGTVER
ncbi:MAG: DUF4229 domain-containing protein [Acidothermaceae bacterium]